MKNKDDKYFSIKNFYVAAFCYAKGMELVRIDRSNPSRCDFVFLNNSQEKNILEVFNFSKEDAPETLLDARKLIVAIKSLKEKLYAE